MALPVAVLDACVLFPEWLRDLFLRLAEAGVLRIAWTDEILEEMRRNLEKSRGLGPEKTTKLLNAMRRAFPDAEVDGYAAHVASMTNHPKDRHVLAAAYAIALSERRAFVVTANLSDFPRSSWPRNVKVLSPDAFLLQATRGNRAAVVDVVWAHAQSRRRPPVSVRELLRGLSLHAPAFVRALERVMPIRTDEQIQRMHQRLSSSIGGDATEFLVAVEDLSITDPEFDAGLAAAAEKNRSAIIAGFRQVLTTHSSQQMMLELLRQWGVTMSLDELLILSPDEFELVLEHAAHSKH